MASKFSDQYLSNEEILDELNNENNSNEDKEYLMKKVKDKFEWNMCRKNGESADELFARNFSDFVNGSMIYSKAVADKMATDHRYLQQEMFKVCYEYIRNLSENYEKGFYDPRNEWACETANKMFNAIK